MSYQTKKYLAKLNFGPWMDAMKFKDFVATGASVIRLAK
jgi:hypothetical protein